jgi:hypothetical protein
MQLRKKGLKEKSTTLDRPSAILKGSISKLLKIGTESIGINSEVPPVAV